MRFRLLIFAGPFVGTCVFRPYAAAPVERARSGSSRAKNFEHPAPSQFSMRHGCARFQFSELGESYTFRERIPEASSRRNNSTFSLLIVGSVSFKSLIFSVFHTLSLKNYIYTVSNSPILQNLSSRTYPPEPILQNLSYSTYPPVRIVWENRSVLRSALKCG